jgi:hypothetical protein
MITVKKTRKNILKGFNLERAILNTIFENTVRRFSKCLEPGGVHFEHYL